MTKTSHVLLPQHWLWNGTVGFLRGRLGTSNAQRKETGVSYLDTRGGDDGGMDFVASCSNGGDWNSLNDC